MIGCSRSANGSGLTAGEKDRSWNALVGVKQHVGLDRESGSPKPPGHFVRLTTVDVDVHRVTAVALRLQP